MRCLGRMLAVAVTGLPRNSPGLGSTPRVLAAVCRLAWDLPGLPHGCLGSVQMP